MSSINDRIDAFIAKFDLKDTQEFRDGLGNFVAGCWEDHFKLCLNETIPEKASKVTKSDKIEDPSECKELNDLRNCTSATLDEFCKKNGIRVGGTKKEKMDRVWRYLQGSNSEEDMSPRGKAKKEKKVNEKHSCYGCTSKGTPCAAAATVEVDGHWFCWRHEEAAAEIIANKEPKEVKQVKAENKVSKKSRDEDTDEDASASKGGASKKKKIVVNKVKKAPEPVVEESEKESETELETDEE